MFVVVRADASIHLGTGHVARSVALGLALRRVGARTLFLCASGPGNQLGWVRDQGFDAVELDTKLPDGPEPWRVDAEADAESTCDALNRLGQKPDWIVVDHYGLDALWERRVCQRGTRLLAIDDLGNRTHASDSLVDPNLQPDAARYDGVLDPRCRRMIGPRYALLRPEFRRGATRPPSRPRRVLACMGGTDPHDALGTVLDAWALLPQARPRLDIVVGAGSPNVLSLCQRCALLPDVELHVQTSKMARLMAQADLMVGSAGGVSWERCCAGLPSVMATTADNQRANLAALARARTGIAIGEWQRVGPVPLAKLLQELIERPSLLARMSARAVALVDGRGAERVAVHMASAWVKVRPAAPDDAAGAWVWRNAESTRRHFHDAAPVPLPQHMSWWQRTLADPQRELLVAEIGSLPVGIVRLDHADDSSTTSIYLDPALVGVGLGPQILRAVQRHVRAASQPRPLRAEILATNTASQRGFERAGFSRQGDYWIWEPKQ